MISEGNSLLQGHGFSVGVSVKFNLVLLALLFLLFNFPITRYTFVYDNRAYFAAPLALLMAIRVLASLTLLDRSISLDVPSKILILAFSILAVLDLVRGNYSPAVGSLLFVLLVLAFNTYNSGKLFRQIVILNRVLDMLVLYSLGTFFFIYGPLSTVSLYGLSIPRFTSFAQQASLVPIIFLLPLSVFLLFSTKRRVFCFIYFTLALCFSGSTYIALMVAFGLLFVIDRIPKALFVALPFILVIVYSSAVLYSISEFVPIEFSAYKKGEEYYSLTEFREDIASGNEAPADWVDMRLMSGLERFVSSD